MRRRWTITTHVTGTPRDVDLVIYDDLRTLRASATRWARQAQGHAPTDFSEAAGVVHGFQRGRVAADGEWTDDPTVAIIRLSRTHLTPLVVSHEVAHAAQHIYGLDHNNGRPVGEHMHSGNENFAHLYGELFSAVWGCVERCT